MSMTSKNRQRITPDRVTDGNTAAGKATADTKDRPAKGARLLWQLYWAWFRMGLFTFGGGYAMLPMIQKEVIDRYHWADEEEVLDYYAVGQCTPGAIAVNTATFIGYKVVGTAGGIISTLGVITPSLLIISVIASLLNHFADYPVVRHALAGIRVAVCVLRVRADVCFHRKTSEERCEGNLLVDHLRGRFCPVILYRDFHRGARDPCGCGRVCHFHHAEKKKNRATDG